MIKISPLLLWTWMQSIWVMHRPWLSNLQITFYDITTVCKWEAKLVSLIYANSEAKRFHIIYNLLHTYYQRNMKHNIQSTTSPCFECSTPVPNGIPKNIFAEPHNESALVVRWDPISDTREVIKGKLAGYKVCYSM